MALSKAVKSRIWTNRHFGSIPKWRWDMMQILIGELAILIALGNEEHEKKVFYYTLVSRCLHLADDLTAKSFKTLRENGRAPFIRELEKQDGTSYSFDSSSDDFIEGPVTEIIGRIIDDYYLNDRRLQLTKGHKQVQLLGETISQITGMVFGSTPAAVKNSLLLGGDGFVTPTFEPIFRS